MERRLAANNENEQSSKSRRHCRDGARSHPGGLGALHAGCWPAVRGMVSSGNGRVGSNDLWLLFRCREAPLVTASRSTCKDSLLSVVQASSPSNLPGPPPEPAGHIMIHGPKTDGSYVVEMRTAGGESLAISVPASDAAVLKYFQSRMPYGLVVPDV